MIQFQCNQCGQTLQTRADVAGKKVKCPQCGEIITVPSTAPLPSSPTTKQSVPTLCGSGARAKIFLSYGRRDAQALADRLRADLEARGYEVWQDIRGIHSGTNWAQEIEDGLRSTQLLVAVLSPHAVRRQGTRDNPDNLDSICLDEIAFARSHSKPILPVMAAFCEPPLFIYRLDYVNLCGWKESQDQYRAGLERLLDGIQAALEGRVRYCTWVDRLRPWDFAGFLNEKRQSFCGRDWLFDEIDAWRASSKERALLITGDPGIGKSALVAELVHRNPGGQVLAYHCCQADTQETLQPARFVRSLAAMIASKLEAYAQRLAEPDLEKALSDENCAGDPASAFEAGILTPLQALPAPKEGVRYLLIDALDEAFALSGGSSRTIVDLLAARLGRFPPWLRIVATTRKEDVVLDRLRGLRAQKLDADDPRNLGDVRHYIANRLRSPNLSERLVANRLERPMVEKALQDKSAGNFLYVVQALDGMERDLFPLDNLDALPPGLYGLYQSFFQRHFPDEASFAAIKLVLQVVLAAREPLTAEQIAQATGLDAEEEFPGLLRRLAVYLPERDNRHVVYHKSLADWLTAKDRRGQIYSVSPKPGHQRLADMGWKEYERDVHTMSAYALKYLPEHLCRCTQWELLEQLLSDFAFLEAKVARGLVFDLAGDLKEAVRSLPEDRPKKHMLRLLEEALRRDIHFIARHVHDYPQALFQSLWNSCWWYDSPEVAKHYVAPKTGLAPETAPWNSTGQKLCHLLEEWRTGRAATAGPWLRSLRPPPSPLGSAQTLVFRGHEGHVMGIDCFPKQSHHNLPRAESQRLRIVSGAKDHTVRIWDGVSGVEQFCLRGHTNRVNSVAFSPDGRLIASASNDRTVRLWDSADGSLLGVLGGHLELVQSVAFSPDGSLLVSGSEDWSVRVWDLGTRKEIGCFRLRGLSEHGAVSCVCFSPDSRRVMSSHTDGTIRIWDLAGNRQAAVLDGQSGRISSFACSPSGDRLAAATAAGVIQIWDVAGQQTVRLIEAIEGLEGGLTVAFSHDGLRIASGGGDKTVRVWEADSGKQLICLRGHESAVTSVAFMPDGHILSSAYDQTIRVWDIGRAGQNLPLQDHIYPIRGLRFSPDGTHLLSWGDDNTLREWNVLDGSERRCDLYGDTRIMTATSSPDGTWLAVGMRDGTITLQNSARKDEMLSLSEHLGEVASLAFNHDGSILASGSRDTTVRVWRVGTRDSVFCLRGHRDLVWQLEFAPDKTRLYSGSADQTVRVWDLSSGSCLQVIEGNGVIDDALGVASATWTAIAGDLETSIERLNEKVAWFPLPLRQLNPHPTRPVWAGALSSYLCLFSLE